MRSNQPAAVFRILVILVAWIALALQQYIIIDNTPENGLTVLQAIGRFLIFFTVLSNLLVAISLTTIAIAPGSAAGRFFSTASFMAATALYVLIVGLVYNLVLRQLWQPTGRDRVADELLHVAVPLLYLIYWIWFASKKGLQWKHAFIWLLYPGLYLAYAIVRGYTEGFYPYFFIDLDKLGAQKVILHSVLLMGAFILFGLLVVAAGKRLSRRKS